MKLSADQVRAAVPVRGTLTISERLDRASGATVAIATLAGGARYEVLIPPLDKVLIGPLRGLNFLLRGVEEVGARKQFETLPQSWWVRLVMPESPAALFGFPPDDDEEPESSVTADAAQWRA